MAGLTDAERRIRESASARKSRLRRERQEARLAEVSPSDGIGDMFELLEAVDNVIIAWGMGWDMDGVLEQLRAAKARLDANGKE